jgi:hypothetical protein
MTGYVRTDTTNNIADGNVISAADLDNEFNGVQAAFNSSTGHTHDGSSAEGAPITKLGPVQDVTISTTVLGVKTTNTVDLGTSSLKFKDFYLAGNALIGGTLGVTGATTLSAALTYGGVTLSNAVTGTGNMVLSASPTLTGTITAAAANFSGAVALNGNATIGDADTDTITQAASYVTGTQLKSAKTATNTLALAAYDVDGAAYTNLITLTAGDTPTLALTSTGVGTINNMSIGATTASTGAFSTLSASSTVTLSGGTENGVAYLNGSKVLTTGSALVFDGTNLGLGVTPSAWGTGGNIQLSTLTFAGNDYSIGSNYYQSGGNKYIGTGPAALYSFYNGQHAWYNAASGTAGNAITFTQAMTLDANGKLLLGPTTGTGMSNSDLGMVNGSSIRFRNAANSAYINAFYFTPSNGLDIGTGGSLSTITFGIAGIGEVGRFDSSGNLLVGQTTKSQTAVGFSATADGIVSTAMAASTSAANSYHLYSTGAGAYRFYVGLNGTINATSVVITAISDQRLKENVRDIDTGLDAVMALKPRRFDWKEGKGQDKKNAAGFIAQEFETVFPECVSTSIAGADGIEYKNINHETLIPTLVKAIQEQQALITQLTARITALEGA